ncbi:DUF1120 domain-containing protein [Pseudomonas sp. HN11]|uniref:DUF1120 domain-containing protein n=1 Tax=Pseudomonas sp. HN11 TaxID=1344094 RepID=UPI001F288093|nr:DUF1120 domain-containing protein [Pseudomonas sp. HN11]UII72541.1 DUF1120 domain-containing protein [Pseudomonas sp. HN11]
MKHLLSALAAMVLVGISNGQAASSVDLSVRGVITPAACTPTLSGGGLVDYGKISAGDLAATGSTRLPPARLQLTVNCEAVTIMAVNVLDNRAGTSLASVFGLGLAPGGKRIGSYYLLTENATGDGIARAMIESSAHSNGWMPADGMQWQANWMRTLNGGSDSSPFPLPVQVLQTEVVVMASINDKSTLPITQEIQLDGNATLDIVYL